MGVTNSLLEGKVTSRLDVITYDTSDGRLEIRVSRNNMSSLLNADYTSCWFK